MIKFFRHIRRNLMETGKTAKYLKYALGEILLVMIGILLALQINNWNEARKASLLELDVLKEIRAALNEDLVDAQYNLASHTRKLASQNIVIDWMESDKPFIDSLSRHFEVLNYGTFFAYYEGPYKTLNQLGMRIIKNDSLRKQISKLYDQTYDSYNMLNTSFGETIDKIDDLNANHFNEWTYNENKMKPLNISSFKADNVYLYQLKYTKNFNRILISETIPDVIEEIKKTMAMIDKELDSRN